MNKGRSRIRPKRRQDRYGFVKDNENAILIIKMLSERVIYAISQRFGTHL